MEGIAVIKSSNLDLRGVFYHIVCARQKESRKTALSVSVLWEVSFNKQGSILTDNTAAHSTAFGTAPGFKRYLNYRTF